MKKERVRLLSDGKKIRGPVIYWMSRDQRASDNWALIYSQELALKQGSPLVVIFCLVPDFLGASIRHFGFMLTGLIETEGYLKKKNIAFRLLQGHPKDEISGFVTRNKVSALVTDFDPLQIKKAWKKDVIDAVDIPVYEVDAHNIIPCWSASPRQEWAAYTFRPKVNRVLDDFLDEIPKIKKHPFLWEEENSNIPWEETIKRLDVNRAVGELDWIKPGERSAKKMLDEFISNRIKGYDIDRNDPNKKGQSDLSPYLHFGQLSAQRAVFEVRNAKVIENEKEAFFEELIVRRELADNFCFYNRYYDDFKGFPDWAKKTLDGHRKDKREYLYPTELLEQAETHDELWNAAQIEMKRKGKMHGYMRMYWAKKILEWTKTPEEAFKTAIYLNDKYELDGRDPNGYTGIAWSLGGVHDRPWFERPVFGKIRYMSLGGAQKKFDVQRYIERYSVSEKQKN
ncbi:MAG: deoxyribodipyrimidine photo-lyase [Candidatus Aminicenantes bacterium]|nr:deoxyribodipyrimidine photo-lyase [Candidatus Aminicenantes bacterium]